jgi:ribosome-associated protein
VPKVKKENPESNPLVRCILFGMQEKKGIDICIINLKKINGAVADYFILCTANTDTQVDAIATEVEKQVYKNLKQNPWQREGLQNKEWVLLDYSDTVVHIFRKEKRNFYNLESLWGDADVRYIGENEMIKLELETEKTNIKKTKATPKKISTKTTTSIKKTLKTKKR